MNVKVSKSKIEGAGKGLFTNQAFKKGDLIIYPKYSGYPIKVDGDEFLILDSKEILAILKEEK